jgi:3-isopropylmalate dehydrogenase
MTDSASSRTHRIALLPGDGIGQEITDEAVKSLRAVGRRFGHTFETVEYPVGWKAIDAYGQALPPQIRDACRDCEAIFLGAVGLPGRDETLPQEQRPERAVLLPLREGNYANLRPVWQPECMAGPGGKVVDILIVRELNGGIYTGEPRGRRQVDGQDEAFDTMRYSRGEIERIVVLAFEAALHRGKRLCSVDKANILASSALWRETVEGVRDRYPEVELRHQLVDSAAPQLIQQSQAFDVLVTGNMFGDILSDLAGVLAGSLGMIPSACVGGQVGLFEPAHGSAPDIMGKDLANPIASILTMGMLLEHALDMHDEALAIRQAVLDVLESGYRTADIMSEGARQVGCRRMGDLIEQRIEARG